MGGDSPGHYVAVVLLVVLAALLTALEAALSTFSRARALELQHEGRPGAVKLLRLLDDPPRHLNVVLFGAQQFRSKIDDEILGNCGTSLYGRVGDEEMVNTAYRSISDTAKAELLGLRKGRLLVRHAHFRAPLFGTFPL